ncbi:hypothetical protein ACN27J_16805 [Solwaraspora sp. WMMB762]|uniref:hypothetical protein n=1 Tax=Solwaraspora sp. WMMB762 TaxID=3404120 RepID=UPI003B96101F
MRSFATPAAAMPAAATTATGPPGTSVVRQADAAHAIGGAHADARPAPESGPRTATDLAAAPLRHAGIRAVQDLGVQQASDQARRRPATAPDTADPRLREHLDSLGQRLLAAHPPTAPAPVTTDRPPTTTPLPVTTDRPSTTTPLPVTTAAATRPATVPPFAGHGTHEMPPSAPPRDTGPGRPAANAEPSLTIDHLEVRVVVEPPPRQQATPAPRPPAETRPAWADSTRRYLRNR